MKLTIIPSDKAVYINGLCYSELDWEGTPSGVNALQWAFDSGWIEYTDINTPNEFIDSLPDWTNNAVAAWQVAYDNAHKPPEPPPPPTAEDNKNHAVWLLSKTDWVNQPDVTDTSVTPHLLNKAEFDAYRLAIRQYAVYPVDGNIDWLTSPQAQWSN